MEKIVIIINGKGGVGKDTLCDFANEVYKVTNISAITPIKNIATNVGWKGEKDQKSRKLLSELKRVFVEYNDLPCQYLVKEYKSFLHSDSQILFVHIREPEEIDKFKKYITTPCITLLVQRGFSENWGNNSDDNVENYNYDYIYDNNKTLSQTRADFILFLENIIYQINKKENE